MVVAMKDIGKKIKQMGRGGLSMLMETSMMATGKMIRLMDLVFTVIWMVLAMRASGRRISSMGKD